MLQRCIGKQWLLDVQEAHILRTAGNEGTTCSDVITHQDGEELISTLSVLKINTAQDTVRWVQRGLPQLRRVHLTQTLVALDTVILVDLAALIEALLEQLVTLSIRVSKTRLTLAPLELV